MAVNARTWPLAVGLLSACGTGGTPVVAVGPAPVPASAPASLPSPPVPARASLPSDPARRLVDEALSLPVRGGVAYWGIVPPADCATAGAGEGMLRFACSTGLEEVSRYFGYYYPVLSLVQGAGGITLGGESHVATGQLVALPGEPPRAQLLLFRPLSAPPDPVAEAAIRRLSKGE